MGVRAAVDSSVLEDLDDGLDAAGRIRREGDLDRVGEPFRPLVAAVESDLRAAFGGRLHGIYLYGSVPRGTAVPARSDLDVSVVLHDHPGSADRVLAARIADDLDDRSVVDEIGILVNGRDEVLSDDQRFDLAFQISCLNRPLWGIDLARELPEQYPVRELAAGITSGTAGAFDRLRLALQDASAARPDRVRQRIGRRIARLAFAAVLHRWPGWTSEPDILLRVVSAFYPDRVAELRTAVRLGWPHRYQEGTNPERDHEAALDLLDHAGWWLAEHRRVTAAP